MCLERQPAAKRARREQQTADSGTTGLPRAVPTPASHRTTASATPARRPWPTAAWARRSTEPAAAGWTTSARTAHAGQMGAKVSRILPGMPALPAVRTCLMFCVLPHDLLYPPPPSPRPTAQFEVHGLCRWYREHDRLVECKVYCREHDRMCACGEMPVRPRWRRMRPRAA
jgi:hypothetical protein